mgnify:CR=1 FL=1
MKLGRASQVGECFELDLNYSKAIEYYQQAIAEGDSDEDLQTKVSRLTRLLEKEAEVVDAPAC